MKSSLESDRRLLRLAYWLTERLFGVPNERSGNLSAATRVFVMAALLIAPPRIGNAQQAAQNGSQVSEDESLAGEVLDPLAHLTQIQIKNMYTSAEYGTDAQPNTVQLRSIFAIRPFAFIPVEQLFRPTIRVVTVANGKGPSTTTAYDDMELLDVFEMPWPNFEETHFRWGLGSYFVVPTASSDRAGKGSWQMGPAGAFSYRGIPGLNIAGLLQQATSFAYTSSKSTPISLLSFQPILSYRLRHGWYLKSSDATWTFNLRHNTSTTIPLSAGFGKVWKISGYYALDTSVSGEWMVYRQFTNRTEQFTVNFQVGLLIPKLEL
jgi:hypothetical protein